MIRSLRWRFFVVVWVLLVAGLVGLGTLLGRWGTVEINRVTSEARMEREMGDASRELAAAALLAGEADSAGMVAALRQVMTSDSLIEGVAVSDGAGNIVATTMPPLPPGELIISPNGEFELRRDEVHDGRRAMVRMAGQGQLIDPRDSLDPRYLIVIPRVQSEVDALMQSEGDIPSLAPSPRGEGAESDRTPASAILTTRIKLALIIGSILAAIVTLAISGPLLGRVSELSRATDRLRHGDLGARVDARGSDELGRLGASFNAMAARLESSEAQRRQMVTDVAHELRTPLTNLVALLEAARDGVRPVDDELLAILQDETGMLNRLVDDLRDLALADAGELAVAREEVDIGVAVLRAASIFPHSHGIVTSIPDQPVVAIADERRLGQVLRNLIQNAVTHSPEPGTVRVTVYTGQAPPPRFARGDSALDGEFADGKLQTQGTVSPRGPAGSEGAEPAGRTPTRSLRHAQGRGDREERSPRGDGPTRGNQAQPVSILVEDHGPGIPADQLARIWERFYRVDPSRSRATGGMGLGLPVAKRLVEAMGGEIAVRSMVDEGCRFEVTLPRNP